ncbi:hypothetical protein LSUE1_G006084, partial [Lachnellula suecica]
IHNTKAACAKVADAIILSAKALNNDLKGFEKTPRQIKGLERMKYQSTFNIKTPENLDDLWKWFGFFNDLYFGGLLTGFCRLEFVDSVIKRGEPNCGGFCAPYFPGEDLDPRFRREQPYCLIVILKEEEWNNPLERIRIYLYRLIHEMIHAIFDIYECRCGNGCKRKTETMKAQGDLGHHDSFDLLRTEAMASEVVEGRARPSDEELQHLRLHPPELQDVLDYHKEHPNEDPRQKDSIIWIKGDTYISRASAIEV